MLDRCKGVVVLSSRQVTVVSLATLVVIPNTTFKTAAALREVARQVPLDRLLIETDSPNLAPIPRRGRPDEPRYVAHVAAGIAELRGAAVVELAQVTSDNYFRWFGSARPYHVDIGGSPPGDLDSARPRRSLHRRTARAPSVWHGHPFVYRKNLG